jgi:hypothetical protein
MVSQLCSNQRRQKESIMISRSDAEWYAFIFLACIAMYRIDHKFDKVMKELKELREKIDKKC